MPFVSSSGTKDETGASVANFAIATPGSIAVGNLLLVTAYIGNAALTHSMTGWTLLMSSNTLGVARVSTFAKVADASDVAAANFTLTISTATTNAKYSEIYNYSGVDAAAVIAGAVSALSNHSAVNAWPSTSITLPVNGILFLQYFNATTATGITSPPTANERRRDTVTSTGKIILIGYDELIAGGGATTRSMTWNAGMTGHTYVLSLPPATVISGAAALTNGTSTLSATGAIAKEGSVALTNGASSLSVSGTVIPGSQALLTNGASALTVTAFRGQFATVSLTNGASSLSVAGVLGKVGSVSLISGAPVLAVAGFLNQFAAVALTNGPATLFVSGKRIIVTLWTNVIGSSSIWTDTPDVNAVWTNNVPTATPWSNA